MSDDDNSQDAAGIRRELMLVELLCSRLCHDVISPVGAVSNGLELVTEYGDGKDSDAMALVTSSAQQAVDKLNFFRVAYGQAGLRQTSMTFGEAAGLLGPMVSSPRVSMLWPDDQRPVSPLPAAGGIKLALNLGLLAVEALPRGGTLNIKVAAQPDRLEFSILAAAAGARLTDEIAAALDGSAQLHEITPRAAQGLLARLLAERLGTHVDVAKKEGSDDEAGILFSVDIPAAT